jgi:hypothetical protein
MNVYEKWQAAKAYFEKNTKEKKPSKTVLKIRQKSKIGGLLKKIVDEVEMAGNKKTPEDKLKLLIKHTKSFESAKDDYIDLLDDLLKDKEKSEFYRKEVDVLKSELELISTTLSGNIVMRKKAVEKWDIVVLIVQNLENTMRTALKKYAVALKKVRARPDVETWNEVMAIQDSPFRSITTAVDSFNILVKRVDKLPNELKEGKKVATMLDLAKVAKEMLTDDDVQLYATKGPSLKLDAADFENSQEEKEAIIEKLDEMNFYARWFRDKLFSPFDVMEDSL